jgi:hypothetical protein
VCLKDQRTYLSQIANLSAKFHTFSNQFNPKILLFKLKSLCPPEVHALIAMWRVGEHRPLAELSVGGELAHLGSATIETAKQTTRLFRAGE